MKIIFIEEYYDYDREDKIKILIARSLANCNNCIVFDEIFDYLNIKESKIILSNIRKIFPELTIIVFSKYLSKKNF